MKPVDKQKRRSYVTDPDICLVCRYGQKGCPCQEHLGKGFVIACIGFFPAAKAI